MLHFAADEELALVRRIIITAAAALAGLLEIFLGNGFLDGAGHPVPGVATGFMGLIDKCFSIGPDGTDGAVVHPGAEFDGLVRLGISFLEILRRGGKGQQQGKNDSRQNRVFHILTVINFREDNHFMRKAEICGGSYFIPRCFLMVS